VPGGCPASPAAGRQWRGCPPAASRSPPVRLPGVHRAEARQHAGQVRAHDHGQVPAHDRRR